MMAKLHYEIDGRGPHVALLHPVGLDLTFLAPVAAVLRNEFTVLCVDQRGHGKSRAWMNWVSNRCRARPDHQKKASKAEGIARSSQST